MGIRKPTCLRSKIAKQAWGLVIAGSLFVNATAWAQKVGSPAKNEGSSILPWVIALGVIVVAAATAFINPKRSHLA